MNEFGEVFENVSLKDYSTFKVGGIAKYLVKPFTKEKLSLLIKYLNKNKIKYYVIGNGSNLIIDDNYFNGVIIKLDYFKDISYEDNLVIVSSGIMLASLVNDNFKHGFTNLSVLSMIPGTVGGSLVGNAGCFGNEIMNHLKYTTVMDKNGDIKILSKDEISYGYRYTSLREKYIVLDATFILEKGNVKETKEKIKEVQHKKITTQPLDKPSVGSVFRNPEGLSAGALIDEAGLKGKKVGGAMVSLKHANFIINENNASFEDIIKLINIIKKEIKEKYDISLVVEPLILKWDEL